VVCSFFLHREFVPYFFGDFEPELDLDLDDPFRLGDGDLLTDLLTLRLRSLGGGDLDLDLRRGGDLLLGGERLG